MHGLGMGEVEKEKNTGEGERKKRESVFVRFAGNLFPVLCLFKQLLLPNSVFTDFKCSFLTPRVLMH